MATPVTRDQFDSQRYLDTYQDVKNNWKGDPYDHYVQYGMKENRQAFERSQPLTNYLSNQIQNPTLPSGTEFQPTLHQVQQNEILTPNGYNLPTTSLNIAPLPQGVSQAVDQQQVLQPITPGSGQVTAVTTTAVDPMQAAQGQVSKEATVQGQLEKLMNFDVQNPPAWAKGAIAKAEEAMAARGLGASSIASTALVQAVQQGALPIAAQDAASYFQMDMTNLSYRQQANLENTRMRQQNMLTDTSILNATEQFNATNEQQKEQFISNMVAQIQTQNAARADVMTQFNTQTDLARQEFNNGLTNQREQFNSQMQFAIDQSNVVWRRQVNTQNTAAINAAMQANVQNKFNMSLNAQNNLWQQFRDESAWMFAASQNAQDRGFNAAMAANNRNYIGQMQYNQTQQSLMSSLGSFAFNLLS